MTLRASPRMMLAAAAAEARTDQNLARMASNENAARENAEATAQVHAVIAPFRLTLSAADGALEAIIDTYTRLRGKEFAATRIMAALGRRR